MLRRGLFWPKKIAQKVRKLRQNVNRDKSATSILDGATSGDGLGAVLISRSQPTILRKIQKKLRGYISAIPRFLHV